MENEGRVVEEEKEASEAGMVEVDAIAGAEYDRAAVATASDVVTTSTDVAALDCPKIEVEYGTPF